MGKNEDDNDFDDADDDVDDNLRKRQILDDAEIDRCSYFVAW
jgi:hypothetical protein